MTVMTEHRAPEQHSDDRARSSLSLQYVIATVIPFALTALLAVNVTFVERLALAAAVAVGAAVTLLSDPQRRGGLAAVLWITAGFGLLMQLRLTTRVWPIPDQFAGIGESVARMLLIVAVGVSALAAVTFATRVARHRCASPRPTVLLLAISGAIVLRFLPAITGDGVSAGTLRLPVAGSVQIGEITRIALIVCSALLIDLLARGRVQSSRYRLIVGLSLAGCLGYVAALAVIDSGPAALTALGLLIVWWSLTRGGRMIPRIVLPLLAVGAGSAVLVFGVAANERLQALAESKLATIGARFGNVAQDDLQLLLGKVALAEGGAIGAGPGASVFAHQVPLANSDMAAAAIGADFGVLMLAVLVALLVGANASLLNALPPRADPLTAAATSLTFLAGVQVLWSTLGALGFVPLTGISAGMLAPTGTTLVACCITTGIALGATDRFPEPRPRRPLSSALHAGVAVVAAAAIITAIMPWSTTGFDVLRQRGDILTSDGTVIATTSQPTGLSSAESAVSPGGEDLAPVRIYPKGALFGEITGRSWGPMGHSLLEEASASTLTCGGTKQWWVHIEELLHPAACVQEDVVVTVDAGLQSEAAAALKGLRGAAVVIDATTGGILTLYSTDTGDPADWTNDEKDTRPLLATSASVAPGSVVKPFVAAVALTEGLTTRGAPRDSFEVDGETIPNHASSVCTDTSIEGSLATSCNTPFAMIATKLGASHLASGLATYFGAERGITFDGLAAGGMYTGLGATPNPAQLARTGIGQESFLASPLSVAAATTYLVAGVNQTTPMTTRVIFGTCDGVEFVPSPSSPANVHPLEPAVASQVFAGMKAAVERDSGTLADLRATASSTGASLAGKTGTAQVPRSVSSSGIAYWTTLVVDGRFVVVVQVLDDESGSNPGKMAAARFVPLLHAAPLLEPAC